MVCYVNDLHNDVISKKLYILLPFTECGALLLLLVDDLTFAVSYVKSANNA